jgi:hypothetical protein
MLEDVALVNKPDENFTPRTNIFVPHIGYVHDGEKYDGAITVWDGKRGVKEQVLALYDIICANESDDN